MLGCETGEARGRQLGTQGFRQEIFELIQQFRRVFKQNLHLRVDRILEHARLADLDQPSNEHQTYVMGVPLFFLICLQDLQEGLVCGLIIGIAQLDLLQVLDRMIELSRLSRTAYEMEIA